MSRKGRDLEVLVAKLEEFVLPDGFTIQSPKYLEDKDTGQRREVDIAISGKVGTNEILILMECRDRKSIEDVTWVEQLSAKCASLNANKIIAVSSSGFSSPALKKAEKLGIEMRTITDLTPEKVKGWFAPQSIGYGRFVSSIIGLGIMLEGGVIADVAGVRTTEKVFRNNADRAVLSPNDLGNIVLSHKDLPFSPVSGPGKMERLDLNIAFPSENLKFSYLSENRYLDIVEMRIVIERRFEYSEIKIKKASEYKNQGDLKMEHIEFDSTDVTIAHEFEIYRGEDEQINLYVKKK